MVLELCAAFPAITHIHFMHFYARLGHCLALDANAKAMGIDDINGVISRTNVNRWPCLPGQGAREFSDKATN